MERYLVILLLTVTGIVLILSGTNFLCKNISHLKNSIKQQGTIVDIIENYTHLVPVKHRKQIPVIRYRDTDGKYRTFLAKHSLNRSKFDVGERISILYNPYSGEAVVNEFYYLWMRSITCYFAGILIIFGTIVIVFKS